VDNEKIPPVAPNLPPSLRKREANPPYRDAASEASLPTLLTLMQTTWDDHGRINWEGATLTVRLRAGTCFVSLICPTSETQTTMEVRSMELLMQEIEDLLRSDKVTWDDTYGKVKKQKKALADARRSK
jgi:hypothetical protein